MAFMQELTKEEVKKRNKGMVEWVEKALNNKHLGVCLYNILHQIKILSEHTEFRFRK